MAPRKTPESNTFKIYAAVGILGVVTVIYLNNNYKEARAARLHEAQQREQAYKLEQAEKPMFESFTQGDTKAISALVTTCLQTISTQSNSTYSVSPDRKDLEKVRWYMDGLHPYDTSKKRAYIALPVMSEKAFLTDLSKSAVDRRTRTKVASLEMSVTYDVEGFMGMKSAWGVLICPLAGGQLGEPKIENFYME